MIELSGEELSAALCRELEHEPVAANATPGHGWWTMVSRLGWWQWESSFTGLASSSPQWLPIDVASSIEFAWRVVDEMKRRGWRVIITECLTSDGWQVEFVKSIPYVCINRVTEYGATAMEAISRAAYAALRSGKGEPS